ncbi:MAG: DUF3303 family protein [Acidobacteriota bacterium]|nr:MAG: DUF3303 family protein [Acidobacteriota bacterium]
MKFMVTWRVHPEKRVDIMKHWIGLTPAQRADCGEGVKMIGRWHNEVEFTGVAIVESNDTAALSAYLMQWNPYMDMDIAPVLDDEESAAVGKKVLNG